MSKRLDPKLWMDVATHIDKDGLCAYCKQPLPQPLNNRDVPRREWTSINHIDSNDDNWQVENLDLMHIHCNNSYRAEMQRKAKLQFLLNLATQPKPASTPASSTVSGERTETQPVSLPKFRIVPVSSDAYSNRKSHECKPLYFRSIYAKVLAGAKRGEWFAYDELNDSTAFEVGEVPNTTGRYLNMMISSAGALEQLPHPKTNREIIIFRHQEYAYMTVDELMELFPPEGLRTVDPERLRRLTLEAEERMNAQNPLERLGITTA